MRSDITWAIPFGTLASSFQQTTWCRTLETWNLCRANDTCVSQVRAGRPVRVIAKPWLCSWAVSPAKHACAYSAYMQCKTGCFGSQSLGITRDHQGAQAAQKAFWLWSEVARQGLKTWNSKVSSTQNLHGATLRRNAFNIWRCCRFLFCKAPRRHKWQCWPWWHAEGPKITAKSQ